MKKSELIVGNKLITECRMWTSFFSVWQFTVDGSGARPSRPPLYTNPKRGIDVTRSETVWKNFDGLRGYSSGLGTILMVWQNFHGLRGYSGGLGTIPKLTVWKMWVFDVCGWPKMNY